MMLPSVNTPAPFAISVTALTKRYGDTLAVDSVSFDVPAGQTTALLGGNGAGKTTTISMLLGLLLPTSGAISVLGRNILTDRFSVLGRMNFSSPYVDLPHRLTVRQNLQVYGHLYGLPNVKTRLAQVADEMALTDFMDKPAGRLSSGQKTRVALAKALLNHPQVLILDEPTASLDPDTADWVRTHLIAYQAQHGATLFMASHNMGEVERMAQNVLMMRGGKLVDQGSPDQLMARHGTQNMEEVFLNVARYKPE